MKEDSKLPFRFPQTAQTQAEEDSSSRVNLTPGRKVGWYQTTRLQKTIHLTSRTHPGWWSPKRTLPSKGRWPGRRAGRTGVTWARADTPTVFYRHGIQIPVERAVGREAQSPAVAIHCRATTSAGSRVSRAARGPCSG